MKNLIMLIALVISSSSFAAGNCYTSAELPGRDQVVQKFTHNETDAFQAFGKFCKDNAKKITCKKKVVENLKAKVEAAEMLKNAPCGEVYQTPGAESTTLSFMDTTKK